MSTDSFADDITIKADSPTRSSVRSKKRQCFDTSPSDPASYMTAGLMRYFDSAEFSDLIVRCRDDEYHVHRIIMCSQSQFFAKACAERFKDFKPPIIDLSADDPEAIDAMLQYCYQLDYADKFLGLNSTGYTIYTLTPHIDVYLIAEKYCIPGLKKLAVDKFEARATVLSRVEVNKEKFFEAIRIIYASTHPTDTCLRKVAVKLCADHSEQYILQGKTASRAFGLMDEIPAFRVDLIKELAQRLN
ncbi:hypothetical protein AOQ84DRAFT_378197 [Glonium stellatum]|uniref:BTB domain-containing protein n=1 Tax=Glonium stellatum TaxID=574774 RepID=A0A8E2JRF4_9PEZI|nr:hypothetical protein AOQ84DRAFT_378197 [Glonium stellatum]